VLAATKTEDTRLKQPHGHRSVLLSETISLLQPQAGETIVDGTLGAGGHAAALLEQIGPTGRLIGIDRDRSALERAGQRLESFGSAFIPVHGSHEQLASILAEHEIEQVDRVLLDLGVSSMQLDDAERGFSFRHDAPIDMRMDCSAGPTAADLLRDSSEEELSRILWRFGEEKQARAIARAIVKARERQPIERTRQLAELIERTVGARAIRTSRIHVATRSFQALRIATNSELVGLKQTVTDAVDHLRSGGRIAVISFNSLEDRPVKHTLRELANRCVCPPDLPRCGCERRDLLRVITSRPVIASDQEREENPRARSAKLRVGEKL